MKRPHCIVFKIFLVLLFILVLRCNSKAQAPAPPTGYVRPVAFAGITPSGNFAYVNIDSSGDLGISGGVLKYVSSRSVASFAPVGLDANGHWKYFSLDDAGNLKVIVTGGGPGSVGSGSTGQFCKYYATGTTCQGYTVQSSDILTWLGYTPFNASNFTLANVLGLWTGSGSCYLRYDVTCDNPSIGGGTVTSVGLDNPNDTLYTVTGSPITGSGTLHFTANTKSANCVVAGPSSGGAAVPTCRSLVTADLPSSDKVRGIAFSIGDPSSSTALSSGSTTTDYFVVPIACTLSAYTLLVDTGTVTVKFWKVASGTAIPTSSNSISTSGVSVSSGTAIHSTTMTDFTTTSVTANDIMAMNVTAVSGAHYVLGVLECDQ